MEDKINQDVKAEEQSKNWKQWQDKEARVSAAFAEVRKRKEDIENQNMDDQMQADENERQDAHKE